MSTHTGPTVCLCVHLSPQRVAARAVKLGLELSRHGANFVLLWFLSSSHRRHVTGQIGGLNTEEMDGKHL